MGLVVQGVDLVVQIHIQLGQGPLQADNPCGGCGCGCGYGYCCDYLRPGHIRGHLMELHLLAQIGLMVGYCFAGAQHYFEDFLDLEVRNALGDAFVNHLSFPIGILGFLVVQHA